MTGHRMDPRIDPIDPDGSRDPSDPSGEQWDRSVAGERWDRSVAGERWDRSVAGQRWDRSVAGQLGIAVRVTPSFPDAARFVGAVEVGLRRNPNRAQLLVSRVLGKHIGVPVGEVRAAADALGSVVRSACAGQTPVVVGFAETATGLGHGVAAISAADGGPAPCLHTTRRPAPAGARVVRFSEEHSHATDQALVLLDDAGLRGNRPLVLVDDELTTGSTAATTTGGPRWSGPCARSEPRSPASRCSTAASRSPPVPSPRCASSSGLGRVRRPGHGRPRGCR